MTGQRLKSLVSVAGAALLAMSPAVDAAALGTTVTVQVSMVKDRQGHVLVALCTEPEFLTEHCSYHGSAAAHAGEVTVRVEGVRPGRYAVQAFHDNNDTRKLERNLFGLPRKALGFSRDAPMRFGPPRFVDAAFDVGNAPAEVRLTLRAP